MIVAQKRYKLSDFEHLLLVLMIGILVKHVSSSVFKRLTILEAARFMHSVHSIHLLICVYHFALQLTDVVKLAPHL